MCFLFFWWKLVYFVLSLFHACDMYLTTLFLIHHSKNETLFLVITGEIYFEDKFTQCVIVLVIVIISTKLLIFEKWTMPKKSDKNLPFLNAIFICHISKSKSYWIIFIIVNKWIKIWSLKFIIWSIIYNTITVKCIVCLRKCACIINILSIIF